MPSTPDSADDKEKAEKEMAEMPEWLKATYRNLSYLFFWLATSALLTFVLFQVHATLIALAITIIGDPALRPTGWYSGTLYPLSRAFWLLLGIIWLGWVTFTEGYLREDADLLLKRVSHLCLIIGSIYLVSYLTLLLIR